MKPEESRHILLTGPMGSGKTTVGRILADRLDRPLVDSDVQIEAEHGETGRELAARHGVAWLHQAEADALRRAVGSDEPAVIGAAASIGDRDDLASLIGGDDIFVVLLMGAAEVLAERAQSGSHRRQLDVQRSQVLAHRRNRRLQEVVDRVVDVTEATPRQVADLILGDGRR